MHPFEQEIADSIARHGLISPQEQCVLVAVSGGADSVALLAALCALGYPCSAMHCNFHLRGEESDRDTRHTADICRRLGVDVSVKHFDVEKRREATGESMEMACRSLRYDWFAEMADSRQCRTVAVAHHRDDNVETMLLNLMRGTGLAGLTGMSPRNGLYVRPMLECTRAEIEGYLADRGLDYVTDSSNASNDYLRNRLRNIVIPDMERCFPGARESMARTIGCLAEAESFYREAVERKRREYMPDDSHIRIDRLIESEPQARLLLFEWLRPMGFNASQAADIIASGRSGAVFESQGIRITLSRGTAEITRAADPKPETYSVDISQTILRPAFIAVSRHVAADFKPERDARVLCLDESVLEGEPEFELRRWRKGDYIEPFGMKGRKKLSDIFSDAKLSLNQKNRMWVLTRNDTVLWIPGLRTSRHFAVGPSTPGYLRLEFRE